MTDDDHLAVKALIALVIFIVVFIIVYAAAQPSLGSGGAVILAVIAVAIVEAAVFGALEVIVKWSG